MHLKWTFVGFRGWRVHIPGGGGIRGRAIGIKAGRYDSGGEWDSVYRHWTRGGFKGDYGGLYSLFLLHVVLLLFLRAIRRKGFSLLLCGWIAFFCW